MNHEKITLSYGSGGRLTLSLIKDLILKYFDDNELKKLDDSAFLELDTRKILFTTDSYTVSPIFFPGGNIGKLAITGTINDLAVCGAEPLFISVGFIIEEGLPSEKIEKILNSMQKTAKESNVRVVTGDTKVVQQGKGDKIFINTSGIGQFKGKKRLGKKFIKPGDVIIINGGIGEHGAVIMGLQKGLNFDFKLKSDCAPLNKMIMDIMKNCDGIKLMRDPTRGGLVTTLNEIVEHTGLSATIYEERLLIRKEVYSLCEILGLDPLYLANEGKVIMIASKDDSQRIIKIMQNHKEGKDARIIGEITKTVEEKVLFKTALGTIRILDVFTGQPLPRIC